jgi:Cu/Ag efflux pump CusA
MWLTGIPVNLLSLGAIDFGIIVEGSIIMMETVLKSGKTTLMRLWTKSTSQKG